MPIVLPHCVWYHVPKTGGSAVARWLRPVYGASSPQHGNLEDSRKHEHLDVEGKATVYTVRHPFSWLVSYWRYAEQTRKHNKDRPGSWSFHPHVQCLKELAACGDPEFSIFVEKALALSPGPVGRVFGYYRQGHAIRVAKQENLEQDLRTILQGLEPDLSIPRKLDSSNVTQHPAPEFDPGLQKAVEEHERSTMDLYHY